MPLTLQQQCVSLICPYCGEKSKWIDNSEIYGKRYGKSYMMYYCKPCDARVGCHNNTQRPLGTLANKELRVARMKAHTVFDNRWKKAGIKRAQAYKRLNEYFNEPIHIGESTKERCYEIIKLLENGVIKI